MSVIGALEDSIDNQSSIKVIYHGGSQAGTLREIAPISINRESGKVRARCYHANVVKTFVIDKIELSVDDFAEQYQLKSTEVKEVDSLDEAIDYYRDTLESLGWHIDFNSEQQVISLHDWFKNGKPKRSPCIELCFDELTWDTTIDANGDFIQINERPKVKPWMLRADGKTTSSFGNLTSAIAKFVCFAEDLSTSLTVPKCKNTRDKACYDAGIDAIHYIIATRKTKGKAQFDRLDEDKDVPFVVPAVTWDSELQAGSLNNKHWVFNVGYAFREALDLIFMERVRNKRKVHLWTQGPIISFKEGDLIRTRCGQKSVQVKYANPMGWDETKNDMYYGNVTYQESTRENGKFKLLETKHATQLEFLEMLING